MHRLFRVFILLIFSVSALAQWVELESGTTNDLSDISAPTGGSAIAVGVNATILRTTDGGVTWTPQTGEPGIDYHAVSFPNPAFGLAAGTSGTILFTNNGGEIWETIETGWMHPYYAAHQLSPQVGAVAGINSVFQPIVGLTTDGWQNYDFRVFYVMHEDVGYEGTIRDIHLFNADTMVAAVQVWDGHGAICRTTNGGSNWETVYWSLREFYATDFGSDTIGCAVGQSGIVATSSDLGITWEEQVTPTNVALWGVSYGLGNEFWAVGNLGHILRSDDGGISWIGQETPIILENLKAVSMANSDTGYIAGENGIILYTTNGGEGTPNNPPGEFWRTMPPDSEWILTFWMPFRITWTQSIDPDGDDVSYILRVWSTDSNNWGDSTFVLSDTGRFVEIYPQTPPGSCTVYWTVRATDGTDTIDAANSQGIFYVYTGVSADDPGSGLPGDFTLSAYPNPFNPTTTLHLSLPVSSEAVLRVFDVNGRLVREMGLGRLASGSHAIVFDGSDLPSGIYVAAVETPTARVVKKLVLMK